jgi:glycosyltransferase involved in cell wall biosynthesis
MTSSDRSVTLDIAFVSQHPRPWRYQRDASFIYRCENLGLALRRLGHRVTFAHLHSLLLPRRFDVVVFMRPIASNVYAHVVKRLRRARAVLLGDFDDLLFDPQFAPFRPAVVNDPGAEARVRGQFERHAEAVRALDGIVVSTEELAHRFRPAHPPIRCTVIPNAPHHAWLSLPRAAPGGPRAITYFSGTRTHDRDFALATGALERLLARRDDLVLRVVGPVTLPPGFPPVERHDRVPFARYAQLVRESYVNLAPLEDTPFNRCKSAVKVLEAGVLGIPTVASPLGEYLRVSTRGVLFAESAARWGEQIEFACDPEKHAWLAEGLRERILRLADVDRFAQAFVRFAAA